MCHYFTEIFNDLENSKKSYVKEKRRKSGYLLFQTEQLFPPTPFRIRKSNKDIKVDRINETPCICSRLLSRLFVV